MLAPLLGYFFCMITMLTAVTVLLTSFSGISTRLKQGSSPSPSACNRSDGHGGGNRAMALTGRERSIASKGCLSGRCHCKSGH